MHALSKLLKNKTTKLQQLLLKNIGLVINDYED